MDRSIDSERLGHLFLPIDISNTSKINTPSMFCMAKVSLLTWRIVTMSILPDGYIPPGQPPPQFPGTIHKMLLLLYQPLFL
jgi:hypothetical protein